MQPKDSRIEWLEEYVNYPELFVEVDDIPSPEDMMYKCKQLSSTEWLWFAEKDGYVSYYLEDTSRPSGLGGRHFEINTVGGPYTLRGPWSSRAAVVNEYTDLKVVDVTLKCVKKGYVRVRGTITLDLAVEALDYYHQYPHYLEKVYEKGFLQQRLPQYVPRKEPVMMNLNRSERLLLRAYKVLSVHGKYDTGEARLVRAKTYDYFEKYFGSKWLDGFTDKEGEDD